MKQWALNVAGTVLFAGGAALLLASSLASPTGSAVSREVAHQPASSLGVLLVLGGIVCVTLAAADLERIVSSPDLSSQAGFERSVQAQDPHQRAMTEQWLYHQLLERLEAQRFAHRTSKRYREGLEAIRAVIDNDHRAYYDPTVRFDHKDSRILAREYRWLHALAERENDFFQVPFHALSSVWDTPDYSRFPYRPLVHRRVHRTPAGALRVLVDAKGRRRASRYVALDVVHYTTDRGYKSILAAWNAQSDDIFRAAERGGWTFFTAAPLPDGYGSLSMVRQVLGLHAQPHSPAFFRKPPEYQARRQPEYYVRFRVRVPAEQIFVEDTFQRDPAGHPLLVRKYALAGRIRARDVVGTPRYGRYATRKLLQEDPAKKGKLHEKPWAG